MVTLTFDAASLGTVILVIVLAGVAGFATALAGMFANFAFGFLFAFVSAVSGDRSLYKEPTHNAGFVLMRAFMYAALCAAAVVLTLLSHSTIAYVCAVVGAFCLPIAIMKLLAR